MPSDALAPADMGMRPVPLFPLRAEPAETGRPGYLGIAEFFRVLRRRMSLILVVAVLGTVAAMVVIAKTVPVYSSSATVMVNLPDQGVDAANPNVVLTPNEETEIQTKVELLQSRNLARATAKSLRLADDPEFAAEKTRKVGPIRWVLQHLVTAPAISADPDEQRKQAERARTEEIVNKLINRLDVERVARSSLIKVTASSTDPQKAARIANRTVETYIRGQVDDARDGREQDIKNLSQRVREVGGYLHSADLAVAQYRKQHGLLDAQPDASGVIQSNQLNGMLAQARADSAVSARRAGSQASGATTSALLAGLQEQETALERRLSELKTFYGPGYSEVIKANAELAALRGRISLESRRIGADLRNEAAAGGARVATIQSDLGGVRSRTFQAGAAAVPLRALQRNAEAVNGLYISLLNQLNQKIGTPADVQPDLAIVSRAPVPDVPSRPVPGRALAMALPGSLALGILLAFAVEAMDTKLRTAEQAERILGLPTLAMVPDVSDEAGPGMPISALVTQRPISRFAEAIRNLLIEVETRGPRGRSRVVVVTSPSGGEGKNTIATSLAAAAASVGRVAVVVDFDLRRPKLGAAQTGAKPGTGVVAYLSGGAAVDDLPVTENEGHFAVIGVGEVPMDPGVLITSPRLPGLIDQLRDRYDLIILNAPPILPVRDAKTLADLGDATLLVLKWGKTNPEAARVAMEMFDRPVTGAVMNMVDYAVHAKRRHGDAIHHIANLNDYFDGPAPSAGPFGITRLARKLRRSVERAA